MECRGNITGMSWENDRNVVGMSLECDGTGNGMTLWWSDLMGRATRTLKGTQNRNGIVWELSWIFVGFISEL